MKKRNVIIATATAAIIGSGIAFAGAKNCRGDGGHQFGKFGEHKIERMMSKIDEHLDLSEQQELALQEILESNKSVLRAGSGPHREFRMELMKLDPTSSNYDTAVANLADEMATQVKQRTMQVASVVKQVAGILTEEQIQDARELIAERMGRMERRHHRVDGDEDSE